MCSSNGRPVLRLAAHSRFQRTQRRHLWIAAVALALSFLPVTVLAAEFATGDDVVITEPVDGDLYLFGSDVYINAPVSGDVIASAARVQINADVAGSVHLVTATAVIRGNVGGSVMIAAADVLLTGDVGHAIRVVASDINVESSRIRGDAILIVGRVHLSDGSTVGGDVVLRSRQATLEGDVGGRIRGRAQTLRIGGTVDDEIRVTVDTLRFVHGAIITHPVHYVSDNEMLVDGGTTITGEVTRTAPDHPTLAETIGNSLLFAVFRFGWAFVLGLALLRVAPQAVVGISDTLRLAPGRSVGWGLLTLLGMPLVVVILAVTVIAIPLALVALALYVFALYASQIPVGYVLGRAIARDRWQSRDQQTEQRRTLALGLAIICLVRSLPIDGWYPVVAFATAVIAFGAITIYVFRPLPDEHPNNSLRV